MTKEELIEFLKQNLKIETHIETSFYNNYILIKLILDKDTISEDKVNIP